VSQRLYQIRVPGINVRWPWARRIVSGEKSIETRGYPIPVHLLNRPLAVIETGAKSVSPSKGGSKARIIGLAIFSRCYKYSSKREWAEDASRHLVKPDDKSFPFEATNEKWAWIVAEVFLLPDEPEAPKKRGIVYAKECSLMVPGHLAERFNLRDGQAEPFAGRSPTIDP